MADSKTPLEANAYYHIYNHAVSKDLLFYEENNYLFFLEKIKQYLSPYFDFIAYCLMPNHFHFVVRVKDSNIIDDVGFRNSKFVDLSLFLSQQLSNLFNGYAQAINKQQQGKGSLFNNRFKRKPILDERYLTKLIHYLHYNPVEAGLCNQVSDWKYSSYNAIVSSKETLIAKNDVLDLFGDIEDFVFCHKVAPLDSGIE